MQKSTFFVAGLLFCASSLFAQQTSVGLRAGYTLSDVLVKEPDGLIIEGNPDFELDEDYRPLHSFHIGIDGRLPISERLSILASILYARKGYIGTLDWPSADATWALHYLNLPLVADFCLWKGLSLQGGVEASWLIDAQVISGGESFDPRNSFSNINEFDFGLVGGLEYRFQKGFFIGARYIFGIAPLEKFEVTNDNGESLGDVASHNIATQISLGYRYTIGD
jgi:hypothetical protein